jgi:hypothetical protein
MSERAARAVVAAAFVFLAALQVHRLDDCDTWWHLATGRLIVQMGSVPQEDPFSFTAPGAPWINPQWLFDLAAYAAWKAGGSPALILASGAFFVASFGALYALARRRLPAVAAVALVVLASQAALERFAVRPEAITFCLVAVYLLVLDRTPPSPAALVGLLALQVLWANCHALSVMGLVLLGTELASATAGLWLPLPSGWRSASRYNSANVTWLAVATVAALAAEAATPFGLSGALFPLRLLGVVRGVDSVSASVIEVKPPVLGQLAPPTAVALVVLVGLAGLALAVSWRRVRLAHLLTAAAFIILALMARRNVGLVGLGVTPLVAAGLAPLAGRAGHILGDRPRLARTLASALVLGLGLATADVVASRYYVRAGLIRTFGFGVSELHFSPRAVDFVDTLGSGVHLLNDDALGGYLLWRDYPRRRVFIDSRFLVYPARVYEEFLALWDARYFPLLAARYGINGVILGLGAPRRVETAAAIATLPGWRIAYLDAGAIVLLADGGPRTMPAGVTDSVFDPRASSRGRWLSGVEEALAHYQRGRAVFYLLGEEGRSLARADFESALHAWPDYDGARVALKVVDGD